MPGGLERPSGNNDSLFLFELLSFYQTHVLPEGIVERLKKDGGNFIATFLRNEQQGYNRVLL